jgi:sugar phosphate isomerase/epimerase
MTSLTRREFLKASSVAGLAAALPLANRLAAVPAPFSRQGPPQLRLSLAAFSFANYFPFNRGKANPNVPAGQATDMFKFVDYCVAQGVSGAELTAYYFEDNDDYLVKLRRHCFLRGISISGTAIANNLTLPKGPARDQEIANVKKWIDRSARLGAPHIRVFIGQTDAVPRPEAEKLAIAGLEECGDYAGKHGIFLGVENHDVMNSAAKMIPFIKSIQSPWVGINIDPGFNTADPYADFAACLPYAVNIQYRPDFNAQGKAHKADVKRLAKLLRDGGYQGWVALKYEAPEDAKTAVPRHLRDLKAAFAAA